MTTLALTLGSVTFQGFELPGTIEGIGGTQALASHDFPGGVRTVQTFGGSPLPVSWSGVFTAGQAVARAQALDRLRATGQTITLRYGSYSWSGIIASFEAKPGHQWWMPYSIRFEPIADTSGVATVPQGLLSNEQLLALQQQALTNIQTGAAGL